MSHPPSSRSPGARILAARLVAGVLADRQMLSESMLDTDPAVRARALRLAGETLRNLARADTVLRPLLRKDPSESVMALLRVATVEMLATGAPAHGVVNEIVGHLRTDKRGGPVAGMANAVLRRASEFDGFDDLPVQPLPGWLRRRLRGLHGEDTVQAIEAAHHAGAALDITLRDGRTPPPGAQALPGGSWRIAEAGQVSALPGFEDGDWWVQDAAAALPVILLGPVAGQSVLDLCAAPGGKTMQLAAMGAQVTALDISEGRLKRLHQNLSRTALSAQVVCADALEWVPPAPFDAILLDAPCSATGTIRRHPDLPFVRKPADLDSLTALQAQMLDRALSMLKPGGRLVYCTCSLLPDEGEDQITAALARHPGLQALPVTLPLGDAALHGWRTLPSHVDGGIDGFYMALLQAPS